MRTSFNRRHVGTAGTAAVVLFGSLALTAASAGPASADVNKIEIKNTASLLRLDVMWGSTANYAPVWLWPNNNSPAQEFNLLTNGTPGWFRIQARHSGKCLMPDFRGSSIGNGTRIIQYSYCGANYANSQWRYVYKGTNTYVIQNRGTGKCLDANDNVFPYPPRSQSRTHLWDCTNYGASNMVNQNWAIQTPVVSGD